MRGEFQYLTATRTLPESHADQDLQRHRQAYERMLAEAASKAVDLPEAFVNFMNNPNLHNTFRSVTDCFFTFPREYTAIRLNPLDAAMHVHFYSDSQSCVLWDLYVHPVGHTASSRATSIFLSRSNPLLRMTNLATKDREPGSLRHRLRRSSIVFGLRIRSGTSNTQEAVNPHRSLQRFRRTWITTEISNPDMLQAEY